MRAINDWLRLFELLKDQIIYFGRKWLVCELLIDKKLKERKKLK